MNAVKIIKDARWRLEVGDITREQYEELIAPLRDVEVVRHGRWIQVSQDRANCDRCNCESGKMIKQGERYFPKFCPECGADMRKDGEAHGTK